MSSVNDAQANSVRNLQGLYSLVVGIALTYAVYQVVKPELRPIPVDLSTLPFFLAFLVTLVPFYHGALRHLDATYIETAGREVRPGALLMDFALLFLEGCLLFALAAFLSSPYSFAWCLVVLLGLDAIWGFAAHLAFSRALPKKAESVWAMINLVAVVVLVLLLVVLDTLSQSPEHTSRALSIAVPVVALLRTVVDYWFCWDSYYPPATEQ